jgi:THO complex subunit 2
MSQEAMVTASLPDLKDVLQACEDAPANADSIRKYFQQIVAYTSTDDTTDTDVESAIEILTSLEFSEATAAVLVGVLWLQTSTLMALQSSASASDATAPSAESLPAALLFLIGAVSQKSPLICKGLLTSLDALVLSAAGVIDSAADLQKKMRGYNTQHYYKQTKFNLLAEESQGYSKIIRAIQQQLELPQKSANVPVFDTSILDLMGTFCLDPARCLDLTLDVLQHSYFLHETNNKSKGSSADGAAAFHIPEQQVLALLQHLPTDKLPQLLGFQLQRRGAGAVAVAGAAVPSSVQPVLRCMTWLVIHEVLKMDDMWPYLPPWLDIMHDTYDQVRTHEQEAVRALSRTKLSSSTDAAASDKPAVDLEPLRHTLAMQWLHLFLQWKEWPRVESTLGAKDWSALCVLFPATVGGAICDWVQDQIDPIYRQVVKPLPWSNQSSSTATVTVTLSLEDLLAKISKPLSFTQESGCIRLRPILFSHLCRILLALLSKQEKESDSCHEFLRIFLLPSLSQFPPNPALSLEMWAVLEKLSYTSRYSLYRSWRGSGLERAALQSDKPLWLVAGELQAGKDVRYTLKRLSKDTIRDTSRAVAKVCHSYPLVVFTTILNQIESYDNLVQVMVDCLRFVTPLSLDVLAFCILSRLSGSAGGVNRSRLKDDGVHVSQWLQSLESFTGAFYKCFPFIELRGILCYVMRRLKDGHVMELGVLRKLLKTAGGWAFADYAPAASLSSTQLEGRAGSTLLRRETMSFGVFQDFNLKASNEIRKVLQVDDMGVSLLILLAQVRHQIVFESTPGPPKPVKLIGNLVDTCQVVMAILLDFLTDSVDDHADSLFRFAKSMPSLVDLHGVYGLDVASAWMLCRPLIRAATTMSKSGSAGDDGEIVPKNDTDHATADALRAFKPTESSRASYQEMYPAATWDHISTALFEAFYANALYDLTCPGEIYASEIGRLNKEIERLSRAKGPAPTNVQPGAAPTMSDEEQLERVKRAVSTLSSDLPVQKKHVASVLKAIETQKVDYFKSETVSKAAATTFLARCIYPRCMQGPDDALYCFHFIMLLHEKGTPGFATLHLLDAMIVTLSRALFGLTEGEAANVSILLFEIWKLVSKWRYDEKAFQGQVAGKPGSFMVDPTEGNEEPVSVSYQDYEVLYNKWHAAIGAVVIGCLKSSEYMHTRNCLIVLTRMVEVYPTRPKLGRQFIKALEPLQSESYPLADIRASAQAYNMQLLRARADGAWKEEDAADVEARMEKDQAAAAARQKKAQEQMAEMKRDSDKITDEIGVEGRRGDRGDRRGPPRPPAPSTAVRDHAVDSRRGGSATTGAKTFEPPTRDAGRGPDDRRGAPRDAGRDREDRWPRGVGNPDSQSATNSSPVRRDTVRAPRDDASKRGGLEGRWEGAGGREAPGRGGREPPSRGDREPPSRGSKRSRDTSPVPNAEGGSNESSQPLAKRVRVEPAANQDDSKRSKEGPGGRRGGSSRSSRRHR